MSFCSNASTIEDNDTVLFRPVGHKQRVLVVKAGDTFHSHVGLLNYSDLIGKRYGDWVELAKGRAQILQVDASIWLGHLPHRTQILYEADISLILTELELKPGKIVIEAGTGSAGLSHFLTNAIAPGHLHTFEFHRARYDQAVKEFKDHKLDQYVTAHNSDVLTEGFEPIESIADAVFIDLPKPSEAIRHVFKAIKPSGARFGSFSPCMEQVQSVVAKLKSYDSTDIRVFECLKQTIRPVKVRLGTRFIKASQGELDAVGHSGYLVFCNLFRE